MLGNLVKNVGKSLINNSGLGSIFGTDNLNNALSGNVSSPTTASFADQDWRVRLSVPNVSSFETSPILEPINRTGGLVFPYTPTIIMSHSASYNALQPIHTNYPFYNYQNSSIDTMTITGDFFVENAVDAKYWIAALHYLRSVTKMFYGAGANLGAPPPVVKLNGYGDFVFKDVPVAITNFTVDLPADVDYVKTGVGGTDANPDSDLFGVAGTILSREQMLQAINGSSAATSGQIGWAPTQSQFAVTVQPMYSRRKVATFDLNKFVKGELGGEGFI